MSALTNRLTIKELWQRKNRIEVFYVTKMLLFFTVLVGFHGFFMVHGWFFIPPVWFFMIPGGFLWFWVGFDGSRLVFMVHD